MTSKWVGQGIKRREDPRLLMGMGTFVDDMTVPNLHHAAILRSPYAHARIVSVDASEALKHPGVIAVVTGEDVEKMTRPFPVVVDTPFKYYCTAVKKARFVGEPVAVVVASDRYVAEDAAELIQVDYEPLTAVVHPEAALDPEAPVLHEEVGNNIVCHRLLDYGNVDDAFEGADLVFEERFVFPRYSSTPLETYAIIADYDPISGVLTIRSNFMGPFTMHLVTATALGLPENKLRFIVPTNIGGSFGIKTSMYPYIALIGLAAMKAGRPVKWIEDRQEHLMASSCQTDRVAYREAAFKNDGTLVGIKSKIIDNVGAYLRAPEPGTTFRPIGNFVGPYNVRNIRIDAYDVVTDKCPTGPNRGYGCAHLYFEQERMMDLAAQKLGLDPAEIRRRNFIEADAFPYTTPTGGIYDSGDYAKALNLALEMSRYPKLREEQARAREEGRLVGIGVAAGVEAAVSNMGYITVALPPEVRSHPDYLPKSGAAEAATVRMGPLGQITVSLSSTPQGQGHETVIAQVVADELGITPDDVEVVDELDTFRSSWSISSGTYSSRFAAIGTSAAVMATRKLKEKVLYLAAHLLGSSPEDLIIEKGTVVDSTNSKKRMPLRRVGGTAHWNPERLPDDMEAGLEAHAVFRFPLAGPPDAQDRVNASNTYGFILEVALVEVDRDTGQVKIQKYVSVHDAGTVINPKIVEGQIYGGMLHGLAGALFEELAYDEEGQFLTGSFVDYVCPTAVETPTLEIGHVCSPSPFTLLGTKGCGESSCYTAPVLMANAVADALAPLGIKVTELPLNPKKVWSLLHQPPSIATR